MPDNTLRSGLFAGEGKVAVGNPSQPDFRHNFFACGLLLAVYSAVVLAALTWTPLWLDELQQLGNRWVMPADRMWKWLEISPGAVPIPAFIQQFSLHLFGYSTFAARLPAALFSIMAVCMFAVVCARLKLRYRLMALALFLAVPLQFRYALEARGYSQGLFFTVLTFWLFLKLSERPSFGGALGYFLSIVVGIFSQPYTLFPVAGQVLSTSLGHKELGPGKKNLTSYASAAMFLGCMSFVPWYILKQRALAGVSGEQDVFSLAQIRPFVLLHDLVGGGYVCTISILGLAVAGIIYGSVGARNRLLMLVVLTSIAGPIAADAVFSYFFANRQLLFALPALVLLAAQGFEVLKGKRPVLAGLLAVAFFLAAGFSDWRDVTVPKDDLARTADEIASHMNAEGCFISGPPKQVYHYVFFHPELESRICGEPPRSSEVITVTADNWSDRQERQTMRDRLSAYKQQGSATFGHMTVTTYRKK